MDFEENQDIKNESEEEMTEISLSDESETAEIPEEEKGKIKTSTAVFVVALAILVTLTVSVVGTIFIMTRLGFNTLGLSYENWDKLKWGISSVKEMYYEDIDEDDIVDGALMGISVALDEYSMYMPSDSAEEFMESVNAENYCGVGMHIYSDTINDRVLVLSTLPDSPAEKAGLNYLDIIKAVDGENVGADVDKASSLLMGEEGTEVVVTVIKAIGEGVYEEKPREIKIVRAEIKQDVVTAKIIKDNIGYIKVTKFGLETYNSFISEFNSLNEKGMEKLILDLRDNPGGYFNTATLIAEIFLEEDDLIISTKDSKGHITEFRASADGVDTEIVILCNENTASASEVLIAALRDNGKAKVVGTKTYGKGVTQSMVPYYDGSMFKITDTRYYTPDGISIDKEGIKPDIIVENTKDGKDAQLETAIKELK